MSSRSMPTVPPAPMPKPDVEVEGEQRIAFELLVATTAGLSVEKLRFGCSYILGRTQDCDIAVPDASVSRRHARITVSENITLEDLGSSNGTRVGGRSLRPKEPVSIGPGSIVSLGSATIILQQAHAIVPHPTPAPPSSVLKQQFQASKGASASVADRIVADATMRHLYATLDQIAPTELSVLILGETGVGKDVFASEVHRRSDRAGAPFLKLNCAALPESLLESELFGHEKGAFTGAAKAKIGLFESANGGTVFLDEVGDMPLSLQAKLLRFLESGEVYRIGSVNPHKVDTRIISATNRNLPLAMRESRFRTDLYFRLNGITFMIPPLRRRKADIAPLAIRFAQLAAAKLGRIAPRLAPSAIAMLESQPWKGNVRELRNVIDRTVALWCGPDSEELTPGAITRDTVLAGEASMTPDDMLDDEKEMATSIDVLRLTPSRPPIVPAAPGATAPQGDLASHLREIERERVLDALTRTGWNQSKAARMLGVTRAVLMHRIKTFGLTRPSELDAVEARGPSSGEQK